MSEAPTLQLGRIPYGPRFMFPAMCLSNESQTVEERLGEVKVMQLKDDDVLLCSYPKSGTHWVGSLLTHLLHGVEHKALMQAQPIESSNGIGLTRPSPRVLVSHLRPQWLPQEHIKTGRKVVLVLRNPKDVVVSLFSHLNRVGLLPDSSSWEWFFDLFMKGEVFMGGMDDYILAWDEAIRNNKGLNVTVVVFEDLKKNGFTILKKIQDHLETDHSDERLQEILETCSFENLKQEASNCDTADILPALADADGKFVVYRKGAIGDWKNWFTVAQNEAFDAYFQKRLSQCKLVEETRLPIA